jgi:hypothetical protein
MATTDSTSESMDGIRVNVDGSIETVTFEGSGDSIGLALTNAIGCDLFDRVALPDNIDVFVDDEGLYRAAYNPVLSEMVRHFVRGSGEYRLHGAGVFLRVNSDGDTLGLTPTQRATVQAEWFPASPLAML